MAAKVTDKSSVALGDIEKQRLADLLNRPLKIGKGTIEGRLVLAPMARLGNAALREMLSRYGGSALMFTEMTSARSVPGGKGYVEGLVWRQGEPSFLACQLFGNDPERMARAARWIEKWGFFGVDINFGCSVAVICRKRCGAALLREPELAGRIVAAVRGAVSIPVFVKFRTGWKDDPSGAVEMAKRFEDSGADALTFHPRVAPDVRTRPPRWDYIRFVKEAVNIPVFGNGNVFHGRDCLAMIDNTGCDGVSLGRIALMKPWVFAEWRGRLTPGAFIFRDAAVEFASLSVRHFGEDSALQRFLQFANYYIANFKFGHALAARLSRARSMDEAVTEIDDFFREPVEILDAPNPALLG
jgi:tRNA-dihydrouridine synthase B